LTCEFILVIDQMRLNLEQNKECLIASSRLKFSLLINGLTDILITVDNIVWRFCFFENCFYYLLQRFEGDDQEKQIYESYLI
jgi:hypothetical protein